MGIQLGMNRKGNHNFLMGMGGNGSTNGMYSRSQSAFYRASARDIDIATPSVRPLRCGILWKRLKILL